MARSNSRIRGAGGTPVGMVNVLAPPLSGPPDVVDALNKEGRAHKMLRQQAAKDNLVPDKNVSRSALTADFSSAGTTGHGVQFTAIATGPGIDRYEWDFGDGATSTVRNPVHVYAAAATYNVKLVVGRTGTYGDLRQDDVSVTKPVVVA